MLWCLQWLKCFGPEDLTEHLTEEYGRGRTHGPGPEWLAGGLLSAHVQTKPSTAIVSQLTGHELLKQLIHSFHVIF